MPSRGETGVGLGPENGFSYSLSWLAREGSGELSETSRVPVIDPNEGPDRAVQPFSSKKASPASAPR